LSQRNLAKSNKLKVTSREGSLTANKGIEEIVKIEVIVEIKAIVVVTRANLSANTKTGLRRSSKNTLLIHNQTSACTI
jgi:hypothetical protein